MDQTPRENTLYRAIAKDYNPKMAAMNICKALEAQDKRIDTLCDQISVLVRAKNEADERIAAMNAADNEPKRRKAKTDEGASE